MVYTRIGLDIGSTTIKAVVLDDGGNIIYSAYERHFSQVLDKTHEMLSSILRAFPNLMGAGVAISGSAGMGLAESIGVPFVQEVYATQVCAEHYSPDADVIIELGGEDAKILFLRGMQDARMNGSCAGGTGAFIDQMATLMGKTPEQLNELAKEHEKIYTIASRCGVFAKSDIQPLLNQGAREQDIAASIFYAVVNQTVGGLAQGRPIEGNVLYLGGPLTFLSELRESFDQTLKLKGTCPKNSLYFVALGAALSVAETTDVQGLLDRIFDDAKGRGFDYMDRLFIDEADYRAFCDRHEKAKVKRADIDTYEGGVCIGIDAGSTTVKFAVVSESGALLESRYQSNSANPVPVIRGFLMDFMRKYPHLPLLRACVTGYGEDLIKNAFHLDLGIVETVAHFKAAQEMVPDVDFILDIGGQDMKCLKIKNGVIDNIYLNEACSSGCGSFLQTFAKALGFEIEDFARLGLFADRPVDLGSRCTVFMNSSVKQAQKDGASLENISAGLSSSVVKNALYKVIRPSGKHELGKKIVVQGGTFLNDAVLRSFEQEMGLHVFRPDIAGVMGAYGAALYALQNREQGSLSSTIGLSELEDFTHEATPANCGRCQNNCPITINRFSSNRLYISGNRCEAPVTNKQADLSLNLFHKKLERLKRYQPKGGARGKIGLPFGLNLYELVPFWHTFFSELGFDVYISPTSSRSLYLSGQGTIPSDTVCFPAKLMHGHIQSLLDMGVETIFYPCMSYNLDEGLGDNHFNCPVVAYYPEVIKANMKQLQGVNFIYGYIGLHNRKALPKKLTEVLAAYYPDLKLKEVKDALELAFGEYERCLSALRDMGDEVIQRAKAQGKPIILLAGRPYHTDPEVNHGIDRLISGMGMAVLSEDAVRLPQKSALPALQVLNQWTYHSRLYGCAAYTLKEPDIHFVQLVSFGCGCDAVTTDECRRILEEGGRIYTQIKIDEIENLGAAKIRLRSLFAAAGIG